MENQPIERKMSLISIGDLFERSFAIYKNNFWTFIKIISINILFFLIVLPFAIGFFLVRNNIYASILLILVALICVLIIAVFAFWIKVSLIFVIKERGRNFSVVQILKDSWPYLGSYAWISFLVGLVVVGGFILFIIPGIIFLVWFCFSTFILVFEGKKGTQALKRSKALVQGYWWSVVGRFLLVALVAAVISWIPFLGSLINLFFTMPFMMIYAYLIYEDLKKIQA